MVNFALLDFEFAEFLLDNRNGLMVNGLVNRLVGTGADQRGQISPVTLVEVEGR